MEPDYEALAVEYVLEFGTNAKYRLDLFYWVQTKFCAQPPKGPGATSEREFQWLRETASRVGHTPVVLLYRMSKPCVEKADDPR